MQAAPDKKTPSQTNVKYIVTFKVIVWPLHMCHGMLVLLYTHIYNMQKTHTIITTERELMVGEREGLCAWIKKGRVENVTGYFLCWGQAVSFLSILVSVFK